MNWVARFFEYKIYKNTLQDWLISLGIIIATIVLARVLYWVISRILRQVTRHSTNRLDDLILERIDTPVVLGIMIVGIRLSMERLTFSAKAELYISRIFIFLGALTLTWLLARITRTVIEHYFSDEQDSTRSHIDRQMVMLVKRASVIVLWAFGIVIALTNAGFNVGALLAGLGIGGLAVALAAQDTVKNIIGGLSVFIDKPFRVGDTIKLRDIEGMVLYIGIRSSRLRTPNGRVLTLPNSQFAENAIENITVEPSKRVATYLSLVYDTPVEKIEEAISILKDIAEKSEYLKSQDSIVFLERFNQFSLDINFIYFITKGTDIHWAQTEVNKQILARFREAGLEFAFPTQTVVQRVKQP